MLDIIWRFTLHGTNFLTGQFHLKDMLGVDRITPKSHTYLLMPVASGGAWAINDPSPSHSVLGSCGHSRPVGPLLFQLCFSVSPPTVARQAFLSLPLRVPGQGLVCGAGCWLPEGVSDPAPLPLQYLLGHWFLSCSPPRWPSG